ncbi:RNA polymerase sigma factor [Paenibacillus hexagrammi]|uniref:RNA polymerase sigma factor n=1 Tax=Paenibacillus hexagrammi TaxID=2908839 RepID=A0ABY3SEN2_9BACL|nr:RNA polymerase sigma factor [Paenibacillus sp. YPD9-1]UJF32448.1 RNA polymerase sigma factor [Paenibacillus sp. YPD9-1]
MDNLTDEQLVEMIRQGQTEAYRIMVERHKNYIYTLIYKMVEHRETAEDLTQEVFVKLYRSLPGFRGESKLTTWLYRMTVNMVSDYRRTQKRKPYVALLDKMKGWLTEPKEQPEQMTLIKDERQQIQNLLAGLPDKYRVILYLYHYKQLSYQEMSQVTGLPVKTIETRLYRGKALLKQKWLEVNPHEQEAGGQRAVHVIPE